MGPIINEGGLRKIQEHVADAVKLGAQLRLGGAAPDGDEYARGYFYSPTVLTDIDMNMQVMREETFGPVAPIAQFGTVEEAVQMANNTPYGLAAYVYTNDLDTAFHAARHIRAGGVGINVNDITEIRAPFGGMKQSGLGRELGEPGLDAYMDIKHVRYRHRPPRS
jgi:acyl-CoA reductase-like NAD-dependent aldehyde dehydrogenase